MAACLLLLSSVASYAWSSPASRTEADIQSLSIAISLYESQHGRFPAKEQYWIELDKAGLFATRSKGEPVDGWGRPLIYRLPGKYGDFDVYSYGADGIDNNGKLDDVSGWAGVNDGFHWKSTWPKGRRTIVVGFILGIGLLLFARFYSVRVIAPLSGSIIALGIIIGNRWLMHPGVNSPREEPILLLSFLASCVLVVLLSIAVSNARKLTQ